jgi:hypothetical protein
MGRKWAVDSYELLTHHLSRATHHSIIFVGSLSSNAAWQLRYQESTYVSLLKTSVFQCISDLIPERSVTQLPAVMKPFDPVPNQSFLQREQVQAVQFTCLNRSDLHRELPIPTGSSSNRWHHCSSENLPGIMGSPPGSTSLFFCILVLLAEKYETMVLWRTYSDD